MADSQPTSNPRIFLWIHPRSVSTVFTKCIAHMDGSMVWTEPYAGTYLNRIFKNPDTFTKYPGMKTFLAQFQRAVDTMDSVKHEYEGGNLQSSLNFTDDEFVKEQLEKPLDEGKRFMFVKDAAWMTSFDQLPKVPFKHTFLIRHPNRTALSMRNLLAHLYEYEGNLEDFGVGPGNHPFLEWDMLSKDPLYKLWNYVRENIDPNPVVIDADDLQNHTGDIMKKYCEAVGIPWDEKYLSWDIDDGYLKYLHGSMEQTVWGKKEGVYKKAFTSGSIAPCSDDIPATIPAGCAGYAEEFIVGYKAMYEHRIKPDK